MEGETVPTYLFEYISPDGTGNNKYVGTDSTFARMKPFYVYVTK